ncbi:MaoC family dehydratase N-terminal domain-containing protein [Plantibacter sp. CFBP 8775]|nr:MaoC family dehydratase N-terminal domain-containing protein [Plantibacter sp. CFBP 8775]MBD8517883.1 MaoC family dehydratase N-terminal domain-containing protein [Plantibacter sp. CFBP 8804]
MEAVDRTEQLDLRPASWYRSTFAIAAPEPVLGEELPAGWEGVHFPFETPFAQLREDGSPAEDGVLPVIDLPRRMYAGEDTEFLSPLRYGDMVTQRTSLGSLVEKQGRAGRLVFADLVREYLVDGEVAVRSTWHDVFLEAQPAVPSPRTAAPEVAAEDALDLDAGADWTVTRSLDSRQLFRFSAVTGNTHRIHYDRQWAREVEGLDDLLVHGPLTRILVLDALTANAGGRRLASVRFRAKAPVLVDTAFRIAGTDGPEGTSVVVRAADGTVLASADATWRP